MIFYGLDLSILGLELVAVSGEHGIEPSVSIKSRELLDQ
jgi:hypothetical protein